MIHSHAPFALKSPFWLHGLLYVLAAHLSGYLLGELAYLLLPEKLIHYPFLFALGGCVLSLPLFLWWFFRNENPIGYLATAAVSQLACGLEGIFIIPVMIALADALISNPDELNPWSFFGVWLAVALLFGGLLLALCLGLLIFTLVRRKVAGSRPKGASRP